MKAWIRSERLGIEDAFRSLDHDFDGKISKEDLKKTLVKILGYEATDVTSVKLDRLYRLMDQYKTDSIQLQDIRRLVEGEGIASTITQFSTPA